MGGVRKREEVWMIQSLLSTYPPPRLIEQAFSEEVQTVCARGSKEVPKRCFLELPNGHVIREFLCGPATRPLLGYLAL